MKNTMLFILAILSTNLFANSIDTIPFNDKSRNLELLALELSNDRGITPQELLEEYHDRKTPTIEAIRKMKKEYNSDMLTVRAILDDAKKLVKIKLLDDRENEKKQYMHRVESFKLFKEEYKSNIYAQEELKNLNLQKNKLELAHAEFVISIDQDIKSLEDRFFIPRNDMVDEKTVYHFTTNVSILKKLENEYYFLVDEERKYNNEYLETIKLAKEKIILKNHNLLNTLNNKKTLDLVK